LSAGSNYQGGSELTFSWDFQQEHIEGSSFNSSPVNGPTQITLSLATASGCTADTIIPISFKPFENPITLQLATYDNETGKNKIVWTDTEGYNIDSIYILRAEGSEPVDPFDTIKYNPNATEYIDHRSFPSQHPYSYALKTKDECGAYSEPTSVHKTIYLDAFQNANQTLQLLWSNYQGRNTGEFILLKGHNPESLIPFVTLNSFYQIYTDDLPLDSAFYQVEAHLYHYPYNPETDASKSNLFRFEEKTFSGSADTLIIDTHLGVPATGEAFIRVYPNPTRDYVNIDLNRFSLYDNYSLKIVDTQGRVVFDKKCSQPSFEINMNEFGTRGLYYLQFLNPENKVLDTKVILLQ